jgi:hypothetical protein
MLAVIKNNDFCSVKKLLVVVNQGMDKEKVKIRQCRASAHFVPQQQQTPPLS